MILCSSIVILKISIVSVLGWAPQKQILRQEFLCIGLITEVISAESSENGGSRTEIKKKPRKKTWVQFQETFSRAQLNPDTPEKLYHAN